MEAKLAQTKVRFLLIWSEARLCWPSLWIPWDKESDESDKGMKVKVVKWC